MTAPLRFATFLAPNMLPVYRFLADRIGQRLHRRVELVVGSSFDSSSKVRLTWGSSAGCPTSGWPPAVPHRSSHWPPRSLPGPATAAVPSTTRT
ncbi:MAG TPA: hypothetical protein VJ140_17765 [Actinomycetota bacterium]|nr:hypothetical protein [Actinomycetota bacterium]